MKFILTAFAILFAINSFSQIIIEKESINNAALISTNKGIALGTGFLLEKKSKSIFFCTAYHVLCKNGIMNSAQDMEFNDSIVEILYHSKNDEIGKFQLDLNKALKEGCIKGDINSDVIAIKIATVQDEQEDGSKQLELMTFVELLKKANLMGMNTDIFFVDEKDVVISRDVYMFGYPAALNLDTGQIDFNYPLVKRGIIAGNNLNNNTIIVDCTIHHGNSGSPVMIAVGNQLKLIGIAIQFVPYYNLKNENGKTVAASVGNSGYGIVRPISYINKLLEELE